MFITACDWSLIAEAAGLEKISLETQKTDEEINYKVYVEPDDIKKEEIKEERTKNSTTWQLSDGNKQTVYYSSDVRYEDENGKLVDYDTTLVDVAEEKSEAGSSLDGYAYENAQGDMKHYIPENINAETPLRMENGDYVLEVAPLFGQTGQDDDSSAEEPEVTAEAAAAAELSDDQNAFDSVSELADVETEAEKVTDIYGVSEEKKTTAVYSSGDNSYELEYIPFETGVKENLILYEKPESNVWQFMFTLDGGMTAKKNSADEGISFYAKDGQDKTVLVGGIQIPYMNDATQENYSEAVTYDLEPVSGEEGTYILTMTADSAYLEDPETKYPVTIDPSYTWIGSSAVYDVYVLSGSSYADLNFYSSTTTGMFAGRTNANGYERTYISFDGLADTISGYSVASAVLTVYETGGGVSGETVQAYIVKAAWDKSTLTWNNRPGYSTLLSSFESTATSNHKGTLDITTYARKVANGTADYGIMLRTETEAVSQYVKMYGSRHSSTSYRPKLVVTYCDKPTSATSVTLASSYIKKGAALKVSWEGIESDALNAVQYCLKEYDLSTKVVGDTLINYTESGSLGNTASGTKTISESAEWDEGEYRIYLRGIDDYGSYAAGKGATFVIDGTVPTLSSASISPSTTESAASNNAQPVITWSGASDSYLKQVQYSIDGGSYASMGTTASGSFTVPEGKITTAGKYSLQGTTQGRYLTGGVPPVRFSM